MLSLGVILSVGWFKCPQRKAIVTRGYEGTTIKWLQIARELFED